MHINAAIQRIRNIFFIFSFTYLSILSPETSAIVALFSRTWGCSGLIPVTIILYFFKSGGKISQNQKIRKRFVINL